MDSRAALARLPKVDRVLNAGALADAPWRPDIKRLVVAQVIDELRRGILAGEAIEVPEAQGVAATVAARLADWTHRFPRRVINATGVILHTNLGRAPLSATARDAMAEAGGYCDLEVSLADGKRGSRFARLRPLLCAVIGAPDAHVVGNNAAALLLSCTVLGAPGGVVLSRGQMVEIGDGFRIATMAGAGGCPVHAVGSTNRTHVRDYEAALDDGAAAVLWVHLSNFSQDGFVAHPGLRELSALCRERKVPFIADLGSGSLGAGLPPAEPTILEYLEQGADVVLASGDKLLGGPQAGIIAGDADMVHRCRRFPMARALRPDKTTLGALHATLVEHARAGTPALPVQNMVGASVDGLRERAQAIATRMGWSDAIVDTAATIGGGSLPGDTVASVALVVPGSRPDRTARLLRLGDPPVFGRIDDGRLLLDLRAVAPEEDDALYAALKALEG